MGRAAGAGAVRRGHGEGSARGCLERGRPGAVRQAGRPAQDHADLEVSRQGPHLGLRADPRHRGGLGRGAASAAVRVGGSAEP
ncbi:Uncharacterised protein [Streptococcus pneumoniae]|nr:Uncharacterised protein [Streptococcus pneumoniae]